MAKKNLIMAAASNLGWDQIEMWAVSAAMAAPGAIGVVVLYEANEALKLKLAGYGFRVLVVDKGGSIWNQRFQHFAAILRDNLNMIDRVVLTDIRDVAFQADPFVWLGRHLTKPFVAVSEGIAYRDEPWNWRNLRSGFPDHAERLAGETARNVGVLAGEARAVSDLCLAISMTAGASGFGIADQSAYNLLLSLEPYRSSAQWLTSEDAFVCQVGTLADPAKIEALRPHLREREPRLFGDAVLTPAGERYAIVHQYDRNPAMVRVLADRLRREVLARRAEMAAAS
jgi:hypothetical protein